MTVIFQTLQGQDITLEDSGIRVTDFNVSSLQPRYETFDLDNRYIVRRNGYDMRTIELGLFFIGTNISDYALRRAELFDILIREEDFYVIDQHIPNRRWKVVSQGFNVNRINASGELSLTLICTNQYAESTFTSLQLNSKEWDIDQFSWDGTINWDELPAYSFNSNSFQINNLGNAIVDPRSSYLNIRLLGRFNNSLTITNDTTGDVFRFNGTIGSGNGLYLNGISYFLDNNNVISDTNRKVITLKPGVNNFRIEGGTIETVSFDFRYLYK